MRTTEVPQQLGSKTLGTWKLKKLIFKCLITLTKYHWNAKSYGRTFNNGLKPITDLTDFFVA